MGALTRGFLKINILKFLEIFDNFKELTNEPPRNFEKIEKKLVMP